MGFSFVFADFLFKTLVQFICTSLLIKSISRIDFSDLAFATLIFGYCAVVLNAAFDSLSNKKLSEGDSEFIEYALVVKIFGYALFSVFAFSFIETNAAESLLIAITVALSLLVEHQDVQLRFKGQYTQFRARLYVSMLVSPLKIYLCHTGAVNVYLFVNLIDVIFVALINSRCLKVVLKIKGVALFLKGQLGSLTKTSISGLTIFTFFRLDQFFVYGYLGRHDYSYYVLAVRFNELVNSSIGIIARYLIPVLFKEENKYFFAFKVLACAQLLAASLVGLGLVAYLNYWVPGYYPAASVYLVLCGSGVFLLFGQIRGVYFVKHDMLAYDIYNAVLGIISFVSVLYVCNDITAQNVAFAYLVGFFVSGFLSTFMYRSGLVFMRMAWRKNG